MMNVLVVQFNKFTFVLNKVIDPLSTQNMLTKKLSRGTQIQCEIAEREMLTIEKHKS